MYCWYIFCNFFRTVITVIHLSQVWQQCIHSVQWGGDELHASVDAMKWIIDYTGAGVIKIHRRGKTHNSRRGDIKCSRRPFRRHINCTFQSIVIQCCSSVSCNTLACMEPDNDRDRRWVCVYGFVYCIFPLVCMWMGGCMLWEPCNAEIRPPCLSSDNVQLIGCLSMTAVYHL